MSACANDWLYKAHVNIEQAKENSSNRLVHAGTSQTTHKKVSHDAHSIASPK